MCIRDRVSTQSTWDIKNMRLWHEFFSSKTFVSISSKYEHSPHELCSKILKSTNHYETLMIDRKSDDLEIRKQYKQLALKIHPDKHLSSQATEAFALLSKAFKCLSDPQKKEAYDRKYYRVNQSKHETRLYTLSVLVPFILMLVLAWILQARKNTNAKQ
eukprot:TRINITY_DN10944_c0_g1_i9.p1 TRINITY_DN10944_c0_g1~~TRINITY_DN10944_c0_g1_i9.p1  ORF type:complete len:159 (-),score=23.35 TRINITY_DN10944_c0_g1_i9:227-703(-)